MRAFAVLTGMVFVDPEERTPPNSKNSGRDLLWFALLALAGVSIAGCGPSNELGRKAVSGTVTLDGKPLDTGSISFQPTGPDGGMSSGTGITNGDFSIPEEKGLPAGRYTVRVYSAVDSVQAEALPGEALRPAKELIPPAWNTQSTQEIEVPADNGADNKFSFDIPSK